MKLHTFYSRCGTCQDTFKTDLGNKKASRCRLFLIPAPQVLYSLGQGDLLAGTRPTEHPAT